MGVRLARGRWIAAAGMAAIALGAAGAAPAQTAYSPAIELETTIGDDFTFAAVGDIIYPLPVARRGDKAFQDAVKPLKDADVAYGNLEMSVIDMESFDGPAAGFMGVPEMVDDLKALGFDLLGRANNHLYDYGPQGMLETNARLKAAGITYAGSGPSFGSAYAPRYFMTDKGRVALVATSTSMSPTYTSLPTIVRAAPASGEAPGRAGVAQIATTQVHVAPRAMGPALEAVRKAFPTGGALYAPTNETPDRFSMMGQAFRLADVDRPQFTYEVDRNDVANLVKSVREGKMKSDFLAFAIHSHETKYPDKPDTDPLPGDFLQPLAREIIDAGADAFVGSGVHVLRGIEIYKGKPIFYGLGEFFRQMDINRPGGQMPVRGDVNSDPAKYESVVAVSRFRQGQVVEIRLYPVDLGNQLRVAHRGVPRAATPEIAQRILKRLQTLSQPYGTRIAIENNVGVIRLAGAADGRR